MPRQPKGVRYGGRQKGTKNKATQDIGDWCRLLVSDPVYRAQLKIRLQTGAMAPGVEAMMWHYAYGKPVEQVQHSGEVSMVTRVIHNHV